VFGVAIATVTLPVVSRIAALGDHVKFRATLARAMRLAIFLTIPSAVGLIILAQPIISIIYERGKFHTNDTMQTAAALQFYAIGLVAYSCIKVLSPAFYAINHRWTPMMVSFLSILVNLLFNWIFIFQLKMGHRGLALSTAFSATLNFGLLYFFMVRFSGALHFRNFLATFWRCCVATLPMVGIVLFLHNWLQHLTGKSIFIRMGGLCVVISLAVAFFVGTCLLLRVEETSAVLALLRAKWNRKKLSNE